MEATGLFFRKEVPCYFDGFWMLTYGEWRTVRKSTRDNE